MSNALSVGIVLECWVLGHVSVHVIDQVGEDAVVTAVEEEQFVWNYDAAVVRVTHVLDWKLGFTDCEQEVSAQREQLGRPGLVTTANMASPRACSCPR